MNDIYFIRLNLQMVRESIKDLPTKGRVKRQALNALFELEIAVEAAELDINGVVSNYINPQPEAA